MVGSRVQGKAHTTLHQPCGLGEGLFDKTEGLTQKILKQKLKRLKIEENKCGWKHKKRKGDTIREMLENPRGVRWKHKKRKGDIV